MKQILSQRVIMNRRRLLKIVLGGLLISVVFVLVVCLYILFDLYWGEPSKNNCKQAIKTVVGKGIPSAWLTSPLHQLGGAKNIRVKDIEIIKIGEAKTSGTKELTPVEARVVGYYDAKLTWRYSDFFNEVDQFYVYKESSGEWKAQYQELDGDKRVIELKDSRAWYSFNKLIASLIDFVNETFYQKEFRERGEFESPEEYQRTAQRFWQEKRTAYRAKLKRFKLPLLQPDKKVTPPDYKTFRLPARFEFGEYSFQNKSFEIRVDFEEMIDFETIQTSGVDIFMRSTTSAYKVPPIPIVGHFTSVYLREEDVERAKQIKTDNQEGNLKMFLDFALYAIDLKILGVTHRKLDVYPLVLQFLSGKIYNTKTDQKLENPLLTWEGDKSVHRVAVSTTRGPFAERSVVVSKNFSDIRLPYDKEGRFPVLQGNQWDYR